MSADRERPMPAAMMTIAEIRNWSSGAHNGPAAYSRDPARPQCPFLGRANEVCRTAGLPPRVGVVDQPLIDRHGGLCVPARKRHGTEQWRVDERAGLIGAGSL